ncbi:hypothetical protein LINGRAHAP2_LOCUS23696, partial [Linum grandiflorum]
MVTVHEEVVVGEPVPGRVPDIVAMETRRMVAMETRRMVAMETELLKTPATRRSILKRWKFKTQRTGRRKKDYF